MALDVSKQVANHVATSRTVVSSVEHHGSVVIGPLEQELKNYFPEGTNLSGIFQGLATYLRDVTQNMQSADITLAQERADDPQYRENRDTSVQNLTKLISRIKSVIPDSLMAQYGINTTTPYDPDELVNYGLKILGLLKEKPELINSTGDKFNLMIDVNSIIEILTSSINDLTNSLNDVNREEREAQVSLGNRNQKIAKWKSTYVGVASILAGFYQLAGRVDLADRIRPTTRKVTGTDRQETVETENDQTKEPEISK